jgi:hypothetical protein
MIFNSYCFNIIQVFLHCTIIFYFSAIYSLPIFLLLHYFLNFISQFIYIYLAYMCVYYTLIYFEVVFVILKLFVFTSFNLKFCSKFVLFYINYSWLSTLVTGSSVTYSQLAYLLTVPISIVQTPVYGFFEYY